jgi:hypothetical protein
VTLVHHDSASVSNLERKDGYGHTANEDCLNVEFNLDRAVLDSTWGLNDLSLNFDNRFSVNGSRKFFALLAGSLLEDNALDSGVDLTHHNETTLTLSADVLGTTSN